MKAFLKIALLSTAMLVAVPAFAGDKTGKEMSNDCKKQISAVTTEIKAIKAKCKTEPTNLSYQTQLSEKEAELVDLKNRQKIFDRAAKLEADAIKAKKDAEKAISEIQKAEKNAASAQERAEKLQKMADKAVAEANEIRLKD